MTAGYTTTSPEKNYWGLFRRRSCLVPTLRCWAAFGICIVVFLIAVIRYLHPFLAVNDPISDGILVVEGWMPDGAMEVVANEFKRDHYKQIYITGGPLERGSLLSEYRTYAESGAAMLLKLGLDSNVVQAVPAPPVRQDRTYASALCLKQWLLKHGIRPTRIHLMSIGPHARRSRLLFQKAMGNNVFVGVTSIPTDEYDPRRWWHYSAGVRVVIGEGLAYLYARLLFVPPKPAAVTSSAAPHSQPL